jgi:hypothetical protein
VADTGIGQFRATTERSELVASTDTEEFLSK